MRTKAKPATMMTTPDTRSEIGLAITRSSGGDPAPADARKILEEFPDSGVQLEPAKFDSRATEGRYRQPASPPH
jgi:hypothetical protein